MYSANQAPLFLAAVVLLGATGEAHGDGKVQLDVSMATPAVLVGQRQIAHLKVGLTGFELERGRRSPINLAIVVDRSSSMQGERIEKAKEAALMIVDRLDDRDVVSVVAYDTSVQVLVPATPLKIGR